MHDARDLRERRVAPEIELGEHLLVGHAARARREVRAVVGAAERAGGRLLVFLEPAKRRLRIDEAPDEPRAGEAVGPGGLARRPGAAQELFARAEGRRLRRGEQKLLYLAVRLGERLLGALAGFRREEVERRDRFVLAPLLLQDPRDRVRIRMAEAHAQAFD